MLIIDKSMRFTILKLPVEDTLCNIIKSNKVYSPTVVQGCANPGELILGATTYNWVEPIWRINSASTSLNNTGVRIGGYFTKDWGCEAYGKDSAGNASSAEYGGIGINDNHWSPYTYAKQSYGMRQPFDYPACMRSSCIVYGFSG